MHCRQKKQSICDLIDYVGGEDFSEQNTEFLDLVNDNVKIFEKSFGSEDLVSSGVFGSNILKEKFQERKNLLFSCNQLLSMLQGLNQDESKVVAEKICKLMDAETKIYNSIISNIDKAMQVLEEGGQTIKELRKSHRLSTLDQSLSFLNDNKEDITQAKEKTETLLYEKIEEMKALIARPIISNEDEEYQKLVAILSDKQTIVEYIMQNSKTFTDQV